MDELNMTCSQCGRIHQGNCSRAQGHEPRRYEPLNARLALREMAQPDQLLAPYWREVAQAAAVLLAGGRLTGVEHVVRVARELVAEAQRPSSEAPR